MAVERVNPSSRTTFIYSALDYRSLRYYVYSSRMFRVMPRPRRSARTTLEMVGLHVRKFCPVSVASPCSRLYFHILRACLNFSFLAFVCGGFLSFWLKSVSAPDILQRNFRFSFLYQVQRRASACLYVSTFGIKQASANIEIRTSESIMMMSSVFYSALDEARGSVPKFC